MASKVTIFGLKACDTCRKALKALGGAGYQAELVDVRADPLSAEDRARFIAAFNEDVINRRSTTWRGLPEAERAQTEDALLEAHPALLKRPVIEVAGALYQGWGKDVQAALL